MSDTRRDQQVDGAARELGGALNGFKREGVVDIQRARMLAAMSELAAERGVANVSVAHVVERAGISRRTFYEIFTDREDCFLTAFDDAIQRIAQRVVPAYTRPGKWRERIRACLIEFLSFLDSDPGTGRLVVVETLGAGRLALERRGLVLAQVIEAVDEGRREAKGGAEPPPLTAEGIAGAVLSVIHGRMVERRPGRLIELVNPLMSMIVLPYLGPSAARRELERAIPKAVVGPVRVAGDPLRDVEMRLTYRTVRVLMAVAANPGASNRIVGDSAGIGDQGQISKLLARLSKLGLVTNSGLGPGRGAPNAWTLTSKGVQVEQVLTGRLGGAGA
jgi:AcrR family transcriptional regulator